MYPIGYKYFCTNLWTRKLSMHYEMFLGGHHNTVYTHEPLPLRYREEPLSHSKELITLNDSRSSCFKLASLIECILGAKYFISCTIQTSSFRSSMAWNGSWLPLLVFQVSAQNYLQSVHCTNDRGNWKKIKGLL